MRANIIHITDHAFFRWQQRVSSDETVNAQKIIDCIKKSKIVSKKELLPFVTPRFKETIYSVYNEILFVLKSVDINEYHLITVITKTNDYIQIIKNLNKKKNIKKEKLPKKKRKKIPARNKKINFIDLDLKH